MEPDMSDKYQTAAHRLHKFVSDDADLSDAEIKECLKAEGVDVGRFLMRLGKVSGRVAKVPTATETSARDGQPRRHQGEKAPR